MKRMQLFELEDFRFFPQWIRKRMTKIMTITHRKMNTAFHVSTLIARIANKQNVGLIFDLCSGNGGPMQEVSDELKKKKLQFSICLSDLYPQNDLVKKYSGNTYLSYFPEPVNAVDPLPEADIITMICSFHHMSPAIAKRILQKVSSQRIRFLFYEISDNRFPKFLWWLALPASFILCLLWTPLVSPLDFKQIFFTYIIPIIPLCIAWDAAVSNARTYTKNDLNEIISAIDMPEDYVCEAGLIKEKYGPKMYFIGYPKKAEA